MKSRGSRTFWFALGAATVLAGGVAFYAAVGPWVRADTGGPPALVGSDELVERPIQGEVKSPDPSLAEVLPNLSLRLDGPNLFGGVDAYLCFENGSGSTIKYATFTATPYNAVDDPVSSEIGGESTKDLVYTGPMSSGWSDLAHWSVPWHNHTIEYVKIEEVLIEYMDGSTESFDFPTPQGTFSDFPQNCRVGEV